MLKLGCRYVTSRGDIITLEDMDVYSNHWLDQYGRRYDMEGNGIGATTGRISKELTDAGDEGINPKDLCGQKKPPLHLVPPAGLIYAAITMDDGAAKYGPFNWRENKVIASIYIAAAMRHITQWFDGEDLASDSKKPHIGHAISSLMILADALETGNLKDDRPLPGAASSLIAKWEKK